MCLLVLYRCIDKESSFKPHVTLLNGGFGIKISFLFITLFGYDIIRPL